MNVYDFDKTIFYPDSTFLFVMYCWLHHPLKMLKHFPAFFVMSIKMVFHKATTKEMKEKLLAFLQDVDDVDALVKKYWDDKWDHFEPWYFKQQQPDDLIISASPDITLKEAARRIGFSLIATTTDPATGRIQGENNSGAAKVARYRAEYGDTPIENFYSDSLKDTPMARLARHAWLVDRGKMTPWPEEELK